MDRNERNLQELSIDFDELERINSAFWENDTKLFQEHQEEDLDPPPEEVKIVTDINDAFASKQRLYENVLAPQLEQNEELKRKQKQELTKKVFTILKWQFIATYVFVLVIIIIIAASNWLKLSDAIIGRIIDFIQFYITSIIAELIAILFFIVKNVFDKSIVDLFSNFDSKGKEEKQTEK